MEGIASLGEVVEVDSILFGLIVSLVNLDIQAPML